MSRIDAEPLYARILVFCGWLKRNGSPLPRRPGPVVKWYYAAFALLSQEFDSPQVHQIGFFIAKGLTYLEDKPQLGSSKSYTLRIAYTLGKNQFLEPRIQMRG